MMRALFLAIITAAAGLLGAQVSWPELHVVDRPSTATAPVARAGHEVLYVQDGEWRLGTLVADGDVTGKDLYAGGEVQEPGKLYLWDEANEQFGSIVYSDGEYSIRNAADDPAVVVVGSLFAADEVDLREGGNLTSSFPLAWIGDMNTHPVADTHRPSIWWVGNGQRLFLSHTQTGGTPNADLGIGAGAITATGPLVAQDTLRVGLTTANKLDVVPGSGEVVVTSGGTPGGGLAVNAVDLTVTTDNPVVIKNTTPGGPAAIEVGENALEKITIASSSHGGTVTSTFGLGIESVDTMSITANDLTVTTTVDLSIDSVDTTSITATDLTVNAPLLVDDDAEVTGDFLQSDAIGTVDIASGNVAIGTGGSGSFVRIGRSDDMFLDVIDDALGMVVTSGGSAGGHLDVVADSINLVGVLGGDYRRSLVTTNQSINTTGEYLESGLTFVQTSTTNSRSIILPTGPSLTSVSNGHFVDIVNVGTQDFIIYPDWAGNSLQYDGDAGMDMLGSYFTLKPGSSCRALMTASGWILVNVSGTIETATAPTPPPGSPPPFESGM